MKAGQDRRCLGHLHEREDPLHHAGAARRAHHDQGKVAVKGVASGAGNLLPHHRAHRPADEAEIHDGENDGDALDSRPPRDDRVVAARPLLRRREAVAIVLQIGEAERIAAGHLHVGLLEGIGVGEQLHIAHRGDAEVAATLRTNAQVLLQALAVQNLAAAVTLLEDIARKFPSTLRGQSLLLFAEPGQSCQPSLARRPFGSASISRHRHDNRGRHPSHQQERSSIADEGQRNPRDGNDAYRHPHVDDDMC